MGQAVAVRADYRTGEVRRFAKRAKDVAQARRLLAIAAVLDGSIEGGCGEDRWNGSADVAGLGNEVQRARTGWSDQHCLTGGAAQARQEAQGHSGSDRGGGSIPAVHGVVRWRACDLIMRLHEEFGLSESDDTIYRALKDLGFSHVSARPKAYKQDPRPWRRSKKICRSRGGSRASSRRAHR